MKLLHIVLRRAMLFVGLLCQRWYLQKYQVKPLLADLDDVTFSYQFHFGAISRKSVSSFAPSDLNYRFALQEECLWVEIKRFLTMDTEHIKQIKTLAISGKIPFVD